MKPTATPKNDVLSKTGTKSNAAPATKQSGFKSEPGAIDKRTHFDQTSKASKPMDKC